MIVEFAPTRDRGCLCSAAVGGGDSAFLVGSNLEGFLPRRDFAYALEYCHA